MMERRFELCMQYGLLSIHWAYRIENYIPGDCLVVARVQDEAIGERDFTNPMSFEQVRGFVSSHKHLLGSQINDCRGIVCGDEIIAFTTPIEVRNHKK